MRTQTSIKPKVLLFFLSAGIALALVSVFLVLRIDYVVNHTLYEFGLQFSYKWAEKYWIYARVILGLLALTVTLDCINAAYVQVGSHVGMVLKPKMIGSLLFVSAAASAISIFFFTQLDLVVHNELYEYGLQFSYIWASQYWANARLMLTLIGLISVINFGSLGYIWTTLYTVKVAPEKLISWLLLASGGIALVLSLIYESSVSALIGLGLIFWGAIMLYARPETYVKETLLSTTALPPIENLNQIIKELGYSGKEVYLPPKYLADFESSKVYIGAKESLDLPLPEQVEKSQGVVFLKELGGILIKPLGAELTRLFESSMGKSFTVVNLHYMELNMPKVLVEDLEIARNFEMKCEDDRVFVRIEGLALQDMYKDARRTPDNETTLDDPISSAIACALAKVTGKPIIIEKEHICEDGKTVDIEYRLLEEPNE